MKFDFEFKGINGAEDVKSRVIHKMEALDKYLVNVRADFHKAFVRIIKGERWGYKVKVDVRLPGKTVVAESKAASLLDAVDQTYHKAARITRKYFERLKDKKR